MLTRSNLLYGKKSPYMFYKTIKIYCVRRLTDIYSCPGDFRSYPQNWEVKAGKVAGK